MPKEGLGAVKGDAETPIIMMVLILIAGLGLFFLHSHCLSRKCSAGKAPVLVDYSCLCVEIPE
jgi:hypothetical protein